MSDFATDHMQTQQNWPLSDFVTHHMQIQNWPMSDFATDHTKRTDLLWGGWLGLLGAAPWSVGYAWPTLPVWTAVCLPPGKCWSPGLSATHQSASTTFNNVNGCYSVSKPYSRCWSSGSSPLQWSLWRNLNSVNSQSCQPFNRLNTFRTAEQALVPHGCTNAARATTALFRKPYFCCLGKQSNWNQFQNELPSDEGRELLSLPTMLFWHSNWQKYDG